MSTVQSYAADARVVPGKARIQVFMVRHGESEANTKAEYVSGRSNHIHLTERGRTQAAALGEYLLENGIKFDRAFSSTAVRAKTTAQICLEAMGFRSEVVEKDDLLEIEMGDWVGKKRNLVYTEDIIRLINVDPWNFAPPNGESPKTVEERMVGFFKTHVFPLADLHTSSEPLRIAIFGHGFAYKCFLRHALQFPPSETYRVAIDNTSVTEIIFADEDLRPHVVRRNDTSHLTAKKIQIT